MVQRQVDVYIFSGCVHNRVVCDIAIALVLVECLARSDPEYITDLCLTRYIQREVVKAGCRINVIRRSLINGT